MIAPTHSSQTLHLLAPLPGGTDPTNPSFKGRLIPTLLAANALTRDDTLVTIGAPQSRAVAESMGLHASMHLCPLLGQTRFLHRRLKSIASSFDRVVCWSDELASIATRLGIECELISTDPTRATISTPMPSNTRVASQDDLEIWTQRKATAHLDITLSMCEPKHASTLDRDESRAAMRLDPDTLCLGAWEDDPSDVDARQFAFMLGLLSVSGYKVAGIIPNNASRMTQALRHHEGLGRPFRLMTTPDPLTSMLPILDACITNPTTPSGASLLLEGILTNANVRAINLSVSGRRGFSRSQRVAAKILEQIESVKTQLSEHAYA